MDKLTKDFIKFEGVLLVILVVLICLLFASCTKTEYITVEKVRNDTTYINKVQRDSIYLHDSTFVKVAGDTVWIERWHTKWQNHLEHDTVYKARTDSVPVPYPVIKEVEKPRSTTEKGLMGVGILSLMALIVFIAFKLKRFLP
ncbi:MAG: hypothetical protein IKC19_00650 [Bacteroidales bacterium]|nr:hypothetical protein [Bacteroidales bacterium]